MNQERFSELFDPMHSRAEIGHHAGDLFWMVQKVSALNPKRIIEIGVNKGGTLKFWEELATETVVGIDINPDVLSNIVWDWRKSGKVSIVIGDSTEQNTFEKVKAIIGSDVDFVYIDGAHEFLNVLKDFENYSKLVRFGGIVGFHDLDPNGNDVWKAFISIKGEKTVCNYRNAIGFCYINPSATDTLLYEPTSYTGYLP